MGFGAELGQHQVKKKNIKISNLASQNILMAWWAPAMMFPFQFGLLPVCGVSPTCSVLTFSVRLVS